MYRYNIHWGQSPFNTFVCLIIRPIFVRYLHSFAEDSFGQRLWVDDARCQLLVQNLSLALQKQSNQNEPPLQNIINSKEADEFLRHFNTFYGDSDDENCAKDNPPHHAAHSSLLNRKVRSTSIDASKLIKARDAAETEEEEPHQVVITGNFPHKQHRQHKQKKRSNNHHGASSSSGEEEVEEEMMSSTTSIPAMMDAIGTLPRFEFHSKPKEESKVVKQVQSTTERSNRNTLPSKWWCPEKAIRTKVCQRFFFTNMDVANKMVGDALSQRLELKVRQNSSLLSTLPDFVPNPTVRKLASSHLEKWLQSPALSGLARKLFSSLVNNLQYVDPPLKEDVDTIENILSMKLKSNQVRS